MASIGYHIIAWSTMVVETRTNIDLGTPIETFIVHMLLLKDPHFLPHDYETRSKLSTNEYLILTEFQNHWVKNVDFLIIAYVI